MTAAQATVAVADADPLRGLNMLVLAPVGAYDGFNTSLHRVHALRSLGLEVQVVDSAIDSRGWRGWPGRARSWLFRHGLPVRLPDKGDDAARLLTHAAAQPWDIIWLEKALTIGPETMAALRRDCPTALLLGFSPDDMHARHNQSQQFLTALSGYDTFLTNKSYNVDELKRLGCPQVLFVGNGFDPASFRPLPVAQADIERLGGDVGFIGSYERDRAQSMLALARAGIAVRIWGDGWERMRERHALLTLEQRPLRGDDFAKACAAFKINLCFLRKLNRDQQTTRSVEIPACGGFMLAERTQEHEQLFAEGLEAEYFASFEELLAKCRHYLAQPSMRRQIAEAGCLRCEQGGYSNASRLQAGLSVALRHRNPPAARMLLGVAGGQQTDALQ